MVLVVKTLFIGKMDGFTDVLLAFYSDLSASSTYAIVSGVETGEDGSTVINYNRRDYITVNRESKHLFLCTYAY